MRYALTILSVLLISVTASWGFDLADSLQDKAIIQMAVKKLLLQDEENRANEKKGLASLNNYVINIDTKNWLEEQGSEKKILSSGDFGRISQNLQVFNSRKDALRFYVIIINDYAVKFKTVIDPTLVGDTFKWNDLQKYTEQQKSVQEIWGKTKVLMDGISVALKDKGFSERMIYFYGQLKVAEYDGKIHHYKFDRLNYYGDFIEPLGTEISKRVKSVVKDAVRNIDQAVINIINGAKAVIDGEDNAPSVDCSQSLEIIAANTKSVRDKEYEKQVADFAKLIDQPTTAQQKGSRYVIIDKPENFGSDDVFTQEILPDKVAMLAQSGMSDYKLYVVFKEIKFVLPSNDWEAFAANVAAKTKVAKERNAIIMVVPYFSMVCAGTNWLGMTVGKGTGIIMPAVYTTASFKAGMNSALSTVGNNWKSTFNQAFKSIPKAHNVYAYSFLWNGDFIQHKVSNQKNVTGYDNFNDIVLNDDGRYEELKKAETFLTSANIDSDIFQEQNETTDEYVNGALSAYFTMVETAMSSEQLVKVKIANDVRQSRITPENATTYARWVWTRKTDRAAHFNLPNVVPDDDFFYGGVNVVTAQEFMHVLDAASFASSFVGLDFIFDSWQAYYAYDKGFYMDAAIASTAVVITGVTASELKLVKGLRHAEFALVKTLYNKKLIVTALSKDRVYASFIPIVYKLNLENILSSGVVSAIQNKQTFLGALGYARKAEYQSLVQVFEKTVNESDAFKQLINSNPSAVAIFFKYSKQKPAASVDEVLELATITKGLPKNQLDDFIVDFGDASFSEAVKKNSKLIEGWKVLDKAGETTVRKNIAELENVTDHLDDVEKAGGYKAWKLSKGLANYPNVRSYLSDSRIKQYLTNEQIRDLENILREAHPDVLKYINDMDVYDFSEMARGYRDLVNVGKSSTLINAVKSSDAFIGKYGWLTYWKLTPDIKYSLKTIEDLKSTGKLLPTGSASDIQLGSLQAFTKSGDFINVPMRYNKSYLGEYAEKGYNNVFSCLEELRKIPERNMNKRTVYSGKTFDKNYFDATFIGGTGKEISYTSFVSSSLDESVAEGFIKLTAQHAGEGKKVAVIQRIISKTGVYIDDLSDWGSNLGRIRHADMPPNVQIQKEVLMNPGRFRQKSEPIPIMENGTQVTIDGFDAYYLDLTEL
jgi:hypothetical protein